METTTGISFAVRTISRRMISEATTEPPPESELKSYPVDISWAGCASNVGADDGPADVASGHGTHVLGSVLGDGSASGDTIQGTAYLAVPTFQAVEQWTTWTGPCAGYPDGYSLTGLPLNLYPFFEDAYAWGSRIHSNSWGDFTKLGEYTDDSQAVDQFIWDHPDMMILYSAGNSGVDANWDGYVDGDSIDSPGTAKNALTVGASENYRLSGGYNPGGTCSTYFQCWGLDFPVNPTRDDRLSQNSEELAAFSGRGPTDDLRIKPDVVAPGTNILSTRSQVASGTGWGTHANTYYLYMGGTSMATPLVAGAAAQVRQYYVVGRGHATPSAALLKATLINSAVDIPGYGVTTQEAGRPIPNNHEGWGRVDVGAATSGDRQFVDGDSVGDKQTSSYTFGVDYSTNPFKVTLVWSDYPASLASAVDLVNDLDLEVTAPGGTIYYGNNFSGGWSVPGGSADRVNNVESVYIQNPAVGQWTVRVEGTNVSQPTNDPQQPFALVAKIPSPPPVAGFSGSPTSGEAPLEVSFTDESTGEITGWEWAFGDLGSSAAQNPTHTYENAGDYAVSLTVTGPGGSDIETKTDYIHVTEPPSLHVDHAAGAPGSYFVFTGQNFVPDAVATISVNGTDLAGTATTNATGALEFALHTSVTMSPGGYFVTARTGSSASTYFRLDPGSDVWPDPGTDPTIEVPDTIGPAASVYFPLVMRAYSPPVPDDPIVNGGFEDGVFVGWVEDSSNGYQIVTEDHVNPTPHSGRWLAWLGGAPDETAYIEQAVTVPIGRSVLHYWQLRYSSAQDCAVDWARLLVNGTPVRTYALCSSTNTAGWVESAVDLSVYAGLSVPLQFLVETSVDTAGHWFIDDVSFEVTAATADVGIPAAPDPGLAPARKVKIAPDAPQP